MLSTGPAWSALGLVVGVDLPASSETGILRRVSALRSAGRLLAGADFARGACRLREARGGVPRHAPDGYVYAPRSEAPCRVPLRLVSSSGHLSRPGRRNEFASIFSLEDTTRPRTASGQMTAGTVGSRRQRLTYNIRGVQLGDGDCRSVECSQVCGAGVSRWSISRAWRRRGSLGCSTSQPMPHRGSGVFGLALISVLWAYDGFADVSFATGEVRDPQRTSPRAIIIGTLAIISIYLAANAALTSARSRALRPRR